MIETFIKQLEKDLELEVPIEANDEGVYELPIGEGIKVAMAERDTCFEFSSLLSPIPDNNLEDFLELTLLGNLFGQGTDRAVLGVDEEYNKLTILLEIEQDITYEEFKGQLEDFLNQIDIWQQAIENHKQGIKPS